MKLGEQIRMIRRYRKVSMKDLAHALDITPEYLSHIETCGKTPSQAFIEKLEITLNVKQNLVVL